MKPGYLTTEFWLTVALVLTGIIALGFAIHSSKPEIGQYVLGGSAFFGGLAKAAWYNRGRVAEKVAEIRGMIGHHDEPAPPAPAPPPAPTPPAPSPEPSLEVIVEAKRSGARARVKKQ